MKYYSIGMGWYLSFEQELSIFGAKITSIEAELVVSLNTRDSPAHSGDGFLYRVKSFFALYILWLRRVKKI